MTAGLAHSASVTIAIRLERCGVARPELDVLPHCLSLEIVEFVAEHVDEPYLAVLRDRRLDGRHQDVLVVLLLDIVDGLEAEDPGRHCR